MKNAACAVIVALALMPAIGAADQGQSKAKEKKTTQSKPEGKAKEKGAPGSPGSSGVAGPGACTPDTTAPVIQSVSASPNALWPPNHRMAPVAISANVTDNCTAATWAVTSISSDEPVNGTGDGDTEPDWSIVSAHAVSLRSERAGSGDGRVYTVTITAKDAANNTSTATTTVTVPHNR
ncbi:MAG TPA: hypothetical protein VNJ03_08045 [Vicinamibacterales bacterium]|nr:hypothetical protein [Vicinamibacterales bacterium]